MRKSHHQNVFDIISKDSIELILSYLDDIRDKCSLLQTRRRFYFWSRTNPRIFGYKGDILNCDAQRYAVIQYLVYHFVVEGTEVYPLRIGNQTAYLRYVYYSKTLELCMFKNQTSCRLYDLINDQVSGIMILSTKSVSINGQPSEILLELFTEFNIKLHHNYRCFRYPLAEVEKKHQGIVDENAALLDSLYYEQSYGYETEPWVDPKEARMNKHWKHNRIKYKSF